MSGERGERGNVMIPAFRRVRTERTKCGGGGICGERQIRRTFFVTETDRFRGQEELEEEEDDEKGCS